MTTLQTIATAHNAQQAAAQSMAQPSAKARATSLLPGVPSQTTAAQPASADLMTRLARELGNHEFERYFEGQARLVMHEGRLEVVVASNLVARLLEGRFGERLASIAAEGIAAEGREGARVEVSFRVDRAAFEAHLRTSPTNSNTNSARSRADAAPADTRVTVQAPRSPVRVEAGRSAMLATRYRLDTFVVGASNRMAHAAAVGITEANPTTPAVFIHGTCGLGKTHLLQGAALRLLESRGGAATVRYTTAEAFTNEFVAAIRGNKMDAFRRMYRRVDLLCIDDVHFLAAKQQTQDELMHTIDTITLEGGRVVLASDEHPREIARISERLVSRFMAGAVVRIDAPDAELKPRLLRHLAERRGLRLDDPAIGLLSERSARVALTGAARAMSVRELEGMLTQVEAVFRLLPDARAADDRVGAALVQRALGMTRSDGAGATIPMRPRKPVQAETIIAEVCRGLNVDLTEFMGKGRHKRVVLARSLCSFLCRRMTTMSYPEIARAMGRTNHSTIITAFDRFKAALDLASPEPLEPGLAPQNPGATLTELTEAMQQRVVRAGT